MISMMRLPPRPMIRPDTTAISLRMIAHHSGGTYLCGMSLAAKISDRSTRAALERIIDKLAQAGIDEVAAKGQRASLHNLRKRTKELRGLLRLMRPGLHKAKTHDRALRDAARALSRARDFEVMLSRFDAAVAPLPEPERFDGLRQQIVDARTAIDDDYIAPAIADYAATLTSCQAELARLRLSDKASKLLWSGIDTTYRMARKQKAIAAKSLARDFDATPFHEWRKSVKRHWYQARFLEKIRPKKMQAHIKAVDDLGELLGDHNDLDVMMAFLDARTGLSPEDCAARDIFRQHVLVQRQELAQAALALADKTLAKPPKALVKKWRGWWQDWCKGRKGRKG